MKFDEVNTIYLMSGGYDFCVIIEGKSMKEISRFVFEKLSTWTAFFRRRPISF
jgi:DNA-binding Lrp family transcriptional regulator